MEDRINDFLNYGSDYSDDSGSGSSDGYSDCSGDGSGDGIGFGYSDGSGDRYRYGDGSGYACAYGYGSGSGSSSGYGYRYGDGYGDGDGSGIKSICSKSVIRIDEIQTCVLHIKDNILHGFILNSDLSMEECYVVKGNGYFAHGRSIKEARAALIEKYMEDMDEDDIFEKFLSGFKKGKKYKGTVFFDWHHYITGSCLMGRESFVKNHGLDLNKEFTVEEFFELCRNDYGGDVIKRLEERWNEENE